MFNRAIDDSQPPRYLNINNERVDGRGRRIEKWVDGNEWPVDCFGRLIDEFDLLTNTRGDRFDRYRRRIGIDHEALVNSNGVLIDEEGNLVVVVVEEEVEDGEVEEEGELSETDKEYIREIDARFAKTKVVELVQVDEDMSESD